MSIKKEVVLRNEIRTIYSSEMQERMKVYFQLNESTRPFPFPLNIHSDFPFISLLLAPPSLPVSF